MNLLVAEDDASSARLMERVLRKAGYDVVLAGDGNAALGALDRGQFDALVTDWMMPQMDGIELIRRIRGRPQPAPFILMVTALDSDEARRYALQVGADDFLAKPLDLALLLERLRTGLARLHQPRPGIPATPSAPRAAAAPFVAVCIAASTGGPPVVSRIFAALQATPHAAFLVVQHGQPWMLEAFAKALAADAWMPVSLAADLQRIAPGSIYVAPGGHHLLVESERLTLRLDDGPPENFVRPAADPLFRSAATVFGSRCLAVVLTGMGRDGALGAAAVAAAGGGVLVQDPASAAVPSMPATVLDLPIGGRAVPLAGLAGAIAHEIEAAALPMSGALAVRRSA